MAIIKWITKEEIETEKNKPKEPTQQEKVEALEQSIAELTILISMGGM